MSDGIGGNDRFLAGLNRAIGGPLGSHALSPQWPTRVLISVMCLVPTIAYAVRWTPSSAGIGSLPGFGVVVAAVFGAFVLLIANMVMASRPDRESDGAMVVFAPLVLLFAGSLSAVVVTTLIAAAVYSWSHYRLAWTGFCLGIACVFSFYSLLFLVPVLLGALSRRRMVEFAVMLCSGFAVWAAVNAFLYAVAPETWTTLYEFSDDSHPVGASPGTLWHIGAHFPLTGEGLVLLEDIGRSYGASHDAAFALFALVCAGIAALVWYAPKKPRLASLLFLTCAGFFLTAAQWPSEASFLLIPLAIWAYPSWGPFLAWQVSEAVYGFISLPANMQEWVAFARWSALVFLVVCVVRAILSPAHDPLDSYEKDDPEGGVFNLETR